MQKKGDPPKLHSRGFALLHCRCPRCRVGRLFPSATYNLSRFGLMHTECPHCGQDLRVEPGFYFGAAYFAYAFGTALSLIFIVLYFLFLDHLSPWWLVGLVVVLTVGLLPLNYRYSRTFFLHLFGGIRFDPRKAVRDDGMYISSDGELHEGVE